MCYHSQWLFWRKKQDPLFESYDSVRLNETITHFYVDLRKLDGGRYKATSFELIPYGLNRFLKSPPKINEFDIVKDWCFTDEKTNFRAQMAEMERMGLAAIEHHPVINEADRSKLYMSMFMNSEALIGIANKEQFDIRLYFFPRCMEDMEKIRKTDLRVHTDPKTLQKWENDKENYSGVMPESPGM